MSIKPLFALLPLLGILFGGTACSSEEEEVWGPAEIKTEFSMHVPALYNRTGRMTGSDVQANQEFSGMEKIRLLPFQTGRGRLTAETALPEKEALESAAQQKVDRLEKGGVIWYRDVYLPLGTDRMLMYGVAAFPHSEEPEVLGMDDFFAHGRTLATLDGGGTLTTLSDIRFVPSNIVTEEMMTKVETRDARMNWVLEWLRGIVGAEDAKGHRWSDSENEELQGLFGQLTGNVQNASSVSLLALVEDLYNDLEKVMAHLSMGGAELQQDRDLVAAVQQAILRQVACGGFVVQLGARVVELPGSVGERVFELQYKEGEADGTHFVNPEFPLCLGLPDGALQVKFVAPTMGKGNYDVAFVRSEGTSVVGNEPWEVYAYPAQLYYMADTPIATSSSLVKEKYKGETTADWKKFVENSLIFDGGKVTPTTRGVLLKNPVTYAVGNLETSVVLAQTRLKDNSLPEKTIDLGGGLKWTGLLVSEQGAVGWNFSREAVGETNRRSYLVYDRQLNGTVAGEIEVKALNPAVPAIPNFTLVYPSKMVEGMVSGTNTDFVHLIFEFENGNEDFHGAGGQLIPAHTRFYLAGGLDLDKMKKNADNQDIHQIFGPGFKTVANVTVNSLKKAYSRVPDFRSVPVELGVGMKVTWEENFSFNVTVR